MHIYLTGEKINNRQVKYMYIHFVSEVWYITPVKKVRGETNNIVFHSSVHFEYIRYYTVRIRRDSRYTYSYTML
jgi:hypothetical protein